MMPAARAALLAMVGLGGTARAMAGRLLALGAAAMVVSSSGWARQRWRWRQAAGAGHSKPHHAGHQRHIPAQVLLALGVLGPVLLTAAYFIIPFGVLEPKHRVLSWLILAGLLTLLAVGMVITTNRTLTDRRVPPPRVVILLLRGGDSTSPQYWAMATHHGQFVGLQTRLDALYFTGVTMATVGYGDIHPTGQVARAVVLVQLVYTGAFLVGGITAVRTRTRAKFVRRMGG